MKVSTAWLGTMVDLEGLTGDQIAESMSLHMAEVEEVIHVGQELDGVVTGRVDAVRPHPEADRLRLCTVDFGAAEALEVVCGAPNVAEGQIICYAPVGTTIPGPDGKGLKLKKAKIRGIVSLGMICAEDELGLGDDHDGILVLPPETPVGQPVADVLDLRDTIIDIENKAITHRPDLWGHVGIARDLAAILRRTFTAPEVESARAAWDEAEGEPWPVTIADPEDCRRYIGVVIDGVVNGKAPLWMRRRLENLGVRSIDLLVDLTNYVLLEQGQPLHAFDTAKLTGTITVRRAAAGEQIACLDDVERTLLDEDLVIADDAHVVAMAGVMGSAGSGMAPDTGTLLLESATFDPARVRRTALRYALRTEASSRFEKTLDPDRAELGALRYTELVLEMVAGARVARKPADVYPAPIPARTIELAYQTVRRSLGVRYSDASVRSTLSALGFAVREVGHHLEVDVPSWRNTKDIEGPEDLVEEVGRVLGYDRVPILAPVVQSRPVRPTATRRLARRTAAILSLELGYAEARRYSFCGPADLEALGIAAVPHLTIANPASETADRLIRTTAAQLLRALADNLHREASASLWEANRLTAPATGTGLPDEQPVVGLVRGRRDDQDASPGATFLSLVADLRALVERLGLARYDVRDGDRAAVVSAGVEPVWLHPGRQAVVASGEHVIAVVGEIAPRPARALGLSGRTAWAELSPTALEAALAEAPRRYTPVLRYPVVPFDVAVVVPRRTPAQDVVRTIESAARDQVRDVGVFDVYEGEGIPQGHRSLALRCELFHVKKTLGPKDAEKLRSKVLRAIEGRGWQVRGG